jgi:hypothetical protein
MAQHDYSCADASGVAFLADLNNALTAIASNNSGNAAPSTTYAYQLWADTTTELLKIRNAANNGWTTVGQLAVANLGLATASALAAAQVFTQSGTGATARSLTDKLQDAIISVRDFPGADPTGATSSTAAFTAAVASTTATIVGIYVPRGTWKLSTSPSIGSKTVTWILAPGALCVDASGNAPGAALPGNVISNSVFWQPWAAGTGATRGAPFSYMGSSSLTAAYPAQGRLGFTALGNPTGNFNAATIGFSSGMINQSSGTAQSSTWNFYGATIADAASVNATTQCVELDIAAMSGSQGRTFGMVIAAGGEIADTASYSASKTFQSVETALQIASNGDTRYANLNFLNGLVIQPGGISTTLNNAIYLGSNLAMRWFNSGNSFVGQVSCSATTGAQAAWMDISQYGVTFSTLLGDGLFQIANSPSTGRTSNYLAVSPGINSADAPSISAKGSATNVDIMLTPKGTTGMINITSSGITATAGTLSGYVPLKINGTTFKLALYNP